MMIVDASVAFKWLVDEEYSRDARAWLSRASMAAPPLLLVELGNALWKRVRRGELRDVDGATRLLARVADLVAVEHDEAVAQRALVLAVELDHPIYDCVYLAMAEWRNQPLLTADKRFVDRVAGTGYAARVEVIG